MSASKSKLPPHLFVVDPDIPADHNGRRTCRCSLVGEAGDAHHTLPDIPEQAEHLRRYETDGGE